jgi:hydroxymethylpyrimidine pyrophosphatase-like HAD family hydrolase
MSDVYRTYLAGHYFDDIAPVDTGPLCAVDVDGVLETRWLTFPATDPSGALALRMLHRHGWRVLLATGRSLEEVRRRCRSYRLAGGVAEYGSVIYVNQTGGSRSLLTSADQAALDDLRTTLRGVGNAYTDPAFHHSVRVHTLDRNGTRGGLSTDTISDVIAEAKVGDRIRSVAGVLQTDFISANVDKGKGLQALAAELGGPAQVSFAIGDTEWDLPMLGLAEHAFAPANAMPSVRRLVRTVGKPGPAGLLAATRRQLGHRCCETCAPPLPGSEDAELLLAALSAVGCGRSEKVRRVLALAGRLWQLERRSRSSHT